MKYCKLRLLLFVLILCLLIPFSGWSQSDAGEEDKASGGKTTLVQAVLCEDIVGNIPLNSTSVFSIERRKAVCFTSFDPVTEKTVIYHHWFHRDQPVAKLNLTIKPPRWATYSSIQLRAEDIGPWRVEIVDSQGRILRVLRFSITD